MDTSIDPLLETARKAGVGLVGMKVMAGGAKPTPFYKVDPDKFSKLTREGAPLAALKWAMKNPNIDTVIPSIVDEDQLQENITAMSVPYSPPTASRWPYGWNRSSRSTAGCAATAKKMVMATLISRSPIGLAPATSV